MSETVQASPYWKWEKAIPAEACNALIREVGELDLNVGIIGHGQNAEYTDLKIRSGKTVFLPENHWFEGIMLNHARYANSSAGWMFDVQGNEMMQVAVYDAGEKYEWHEDESLLSRGRGFHRKLSVVCQLSAAEDFTGGGLYIEGQNESVLNNQGDLVVFPSFMKHTAKTVESGRRVTIVCWLTGKQFS